MKRREFGSVTGLASGRFRARWTQGGRMVSAPHTFATRRDAERFLIKKRAEVLGMDASAEVLGASLSLADYVSEYLEISRGRLKPRTLDLYQRTARRWITAQVGPVNLAPLPLTNITPALIREWHAAVTLAARESAQAHHSGERAMHPARAWAIAQGLDVRPTGRLSPVILKAWNKAGSPTIARPGTANTGATQAAHAYRLMRAIMNQAAADGLITVSPCKLKGAGTTHPAERLPITGPEVFTLADAAPPYYRAAILTAALSGLRPGEVFALQRQDVDLERGTLSVARALEEIPGQPITLGTLKSHASRRTIALPPTVTKALSDHLGQYVDGEPHALIFARADGGPISNATRGRIMRNARTAINRPDLTWHHLRHTGATLAAQAGATQAELQRRIGHSTTRAAAIYQHASAERDQWIAQQLEHLTTPPKPTPPPAPPTTPASETPVTPEALTPIATRRRAHLTLMRTA